MTKMRRRLFVPFLVGRNSQNHGHIRKPHDGGGPDGLGSTLIPKVNRETRYGRIQLGSRAHQDLRRAVVGEVAAVVSAHKGRGPDKRALVGQTATFLQILLTLGEPTETGTGFLTVSSAECRSEFESGIAGHPGGCWRCVAEAEQLRGARR